MSGCAARLQFKKGRRARPGLPALVAEYISKWRVRAREELDGFRKDTFDAAVGRAALAEDERGKRFPHQTRIPRRVLLTARKSLLDALPELQRAKDFDDLHDSIKRSLAGIRGVGSLYFYDTALRIGANLQKLPERVYLHRGTRVGARALGLDRRQDCLDPRDLPREIRVLEPHEIEDFLCLYARDLARALTNR